MSISSEITRITTAVANAYTEAEGKGAEMPASLTVANLAQTIASISGGGKAEIIELYNNENYSVNINTTTTTAIATLNVPNIHKYPAVICLISDNAETKVTGTKKSKFVNSITYLVNNTYWTGEIKYFCSCTGLAYLNRTTTQKITTQSTYTNFEGLSIYGLSSANGGQTTLYGRCSSSFYPRIQGTFTIRILAFTIGWV